MKKYFLLFSSCLISACTAVLPSKPITPEMQALWQTNQIQLSALQQWQINGRIAITTPDENWVANVYWQQRNNQYHLQFHVPPGQGVMALNGNAGAVTLRTSDNQTFVAQNPDELIEKVLKLAIPVTGLNYWIRGIPKPIELLDNYQLDEMGYLYTLQQDGWAIEYKRYQTIDNLHLPDKMTLQNDQFKVKIAISEWQVNFPN